MNYLPPKDEPIAIKVGDTKILPEMSMLGTQNNTLQKQV